MLIIERERELILNLIFSRLGVDILTDKNTL